VIGLSVTSDTAADILSAIAGGASTTTTPSWVTKNIELYPPADTTFTPGLISCSSYSGPCANVRFEKRAEKRIKAAVTEEYLTIVVYMEVYQPPVLISVVRPAYYFCL
jgi:hypothetical protein